ncbi:MAG: hypothetical protein F6K23_22095 [Okeania sp. SIO2C9]|uniref:hypothetical protein n=1 Tax=Okeania sp. SIO2C9 TaxID=2607791 RepID=UPI0013BED68B|nr:hypothetical protein [Okeania sp. SIO2C9]NEQ75505.1 hypothetical protein [Okeania sp. SIO2C9]
MAWIFAGNLSFFLPVACCLPELLPVAYLLYKTDATGHDISHFVFKEKEQLFDYRDEEVAMIFVELPKFPKELEDLGGATLSFISNPFNSV